LRWRKLPNVGIIDGRRAVALPQVTLRNDSVGNCGKKGALMSIHTAMSWESLGGLDLFGGLAAEVLGEAMALARCRVLAKQTRVFNQGDGEARAHILVKGSVRIVQSGSDGAHIVVRFIGPGDMFGAMALFTDRRYPADAETITDAVEVSWSEADLLSLMNRHPRVAVNALTIAGKRLQEAQERLRELATQPVGRRIAHMLLRLAGRFGHRGSDGCAIAIPLRRKDIADICGTTLYSVSRVLTAWEKQGFVMTRDQHLTLVKLANIRRIAENGAA
jgi:CRP-like cAMP-binding protein